MHPKAQTVELHAGLYQCSGVAWFDDLALQDASRDQILTADFEDRFDPDRPAARNWWRSDRGLCELQDQVRRSGKCALKATLRYALPPEARLNTRHGLPEDGLTVEPTQLGVFQPDYALERVQYARAAFAQCVAPPDLRLEGALEGYAASGVAGFDQARWQV